MKSSQPQKSKLRIDARLVLSGEQVEALGPLGKRVRVAWDEANCQAARARSCGLEAVKAALLCGEALLEVKGVLGHGRWLAWLERHCADVARSIVTAQKWMRLAQANKNGVFILEEAGSLTDAYRKVGILPALGSAGEGEDGKGDGDGEVDGEARLLEGLVSKLKAIANVRSAVAGWSVDRRRQLAEELRPVIELYHELIPEAKGALPPGKESI